MFKVNKNKNRIKNQIDNETGACFYLTFGVFIVNNQNVCYKQVPLSLY